VAPFFCDDIATPCEKTREAPARAASL